MFHMEGMHMPAYIDVQVNTPLQVKHALVIYAHMFPQQMYSLWLGDIFHDCAWCGSLLNYLLLFAT